MSRPEDAWFGSNLISAAPASRRRGCAELAQRPRRDVRLELAAESDSELVRLTANR